MDQLKFVVLDEEDLEVASAHLQDAVVKVSDVLWRPQEKRVVVALNRFDWESAQGSSSDLRRTLKSRRLTCKTRWSRSPMSSGARRKSASSSRSIGSTGKAPKAALQI